MTPPEEEPAKLSLSAQTTLRQAVLAFTRGLAGAGVPSPSRDARILIENILGLDAAALLRDPDRPLGSEALPRLLEAFARRAAREPVSRILGKREFYGREFIVTPAVLDPRPDTETIIELTLDLVRANNWLDRDIVIADVGTGSGALIVTLLAELPHALGIATDISADALDIARRNASRHGVLSRLQLKETSILGAVEGPLHVIVSNPPYIPTADIALLDADVRLFDPEISLDGGADGLGIYRQLFSERLKLSSDGFFVVEIGVGQFIDIKQIYENFGLGVIEQRSDLGGHIRAVAGKLH